MVHAPLQNIVVRNYYGPGRFSELNDENTGANVAAESTFIDINYEGLMYDQYSVWKPDTINPLSSYESQYDSKSRTSSQTCTAYRAVQDTTNFILKQGKKFNLVQGYRIYEDERSLAAKYQGESEIITAIFVETSFAFIGLST